jgi:hypothetical protein
MSKVAVKAELVSSIFTLVQIEADMPRTKAALSGALRVGAEEMTSQITNGMISPLVKGAPANRVTKKNGNGKKAKGATPKDRETRLRELAASWRRLKARSAARLRPKR